MKKIFLVMAIAASSIASAQPTRDTFWFKQFQPNPQVNANKQPKTYGFNYSPQVLGQAKLLHTLPNGNKVYALPQDNMPCVVPNMSQNIAIPTIRPEVFRNPMPNPAYPAPSKPKTMTDEQLNKFLELHPSVKFK